MSLEHDHMVNKHMLLNAFDTIRNMYTTVQLSQYEAKKLLKF